MNLNELQKRLKDLIQEGATLHAVTEGDEARALNEDEVKRSGEISTEIRSTSEQIQTLSHREEWDAQRAQAERDSEWVPGPRALDDVESTESRTDYNGWPVDEADEFFLAVRGMARGTRTLPASMNPELRDTFTAALESPETRITGQGTLIDSEGGFLVPETISKTIFQKVHNEGQLIKRTQKVPITVGNSTQWNAVKESSRTSGNRYGGITVARKGEGVAATGSKAKFDRVKLELKKLSALVTASEEQLEDGPQLRTVIFDLVPKAFVFKIEDEIVNGNGATQMQGILNMPALVSVAKETGQLLDTVVFENIVKMYARLHALAPGAVFLINQDVLPQLMVMTLAVGTGGIPVYMPANGAASAPFGTLMGRSILPVEHSATLGDKGDIMLCDLGQYLYATKGGVRTAESIHVKFAEDEMTFRFIQRNDGKSWWPAALTPAKGSNTQSPFIALDARA